MNSLLFCKLCRRVYHPFDHRWIRLTKFAIAKIKELEIKTEETLCSECRKNLSEGR